MDNTEIIKERLEELRQELRNECISYGELVELESYRSYIEEDDKELLYAIGELDC
jgi:endo-alpha-1,4-polygalactosaminidase (GH114 family)